MSASGTAALALRFDLPGGWKLEVDQENPKWWDLCCPEGYSVTQMVEEYARALAVVVLSSASSQPDEAATKPAGMTVDDAMVERAWRSLPRCKASKPQVRVALEAALNAAPAHLEPSRRQHAAGMSRGSWTYRITNAGQKAKEGMHK